MPVTWPVIGIAVVIGLLIVVLVWWSGPSLLGGGDAETRSMPATVTSPSECTSAEAVEAVQFEFDGATREGTLSGCGHDQGEQVQIAVGHDPPDGVIDVQLAAAASGAGEWRRPVGLVLLVLSCASGAVYAFLVARGPRRFAPA